MPTDEESRKVGDDGIANRTLRSAVSSRITVLTGGPGTGKTHTLTRCIAVLLASREERLADLSVALVAPTGKAATRAKELITAFVESERSSLGAPGGLSEAVIDAMASIEPRTIHRLLGSVGGKQTRFAHHQTELLPHDIIVVDEMSMVPTHLMARLMEAIRPDASVLLVGDHAQLESVESGSVLRGIIEPGPGGAPGRSWVFELRRVWRQSSDTRIGDLARLIRDGRSAEAVDLALTQPAGVGFVEITIVGKVPDSIVADVIVAMEKVRDLAQATDPTSHREAHILLSRYKVLCGPRRGDVGVVEWNRHVKEAVLGVVRPGEMVPGLPLLVTVNSPRARLVNGDIGLVVNHLDENGSVTSRVYFPGEDGGRYLTPAELPPVEECFAMTVHKSQGSEYE
ncbi:MAG: ATP-dependent RecD-like DNA helicase, partial [Actinomycetota bacterium]